MNTKLENRIALNRRIAASISRVGRRVLVDKNAFEAALAGRDADPGTPRKFVTIPQLVTSHPAFTEASVRQLIARAERSAVSPI